MEMYELLCARWAELFGALDDDEQAKLNALVLVDDEAQIRANVELLLGLGDCGLCHVLKKDSEGGQLVLAEGLSHELLWKRAILEHVTVEESAWFCVYEHGYFDRLEFFVFESVSYGDLS